MKYFSQKNLSMILSIAIVIVVVLIFAFSSFIKQAQADWYSTGGTWNYRKTITIDNVKVPNTDQTDFPVLVDITDSDLAANARSDGFDIFFTSSDGTTKLAHEREIYTTATGRLTTWVKVPTLSTSVDTLIYMYYGNASSGDMQDVAPIKTAVWDSNYKGVWHLGDGDSTAANFYQDSTTGNSDGTLTDGDGDVTQTDGQIGKAMNFNTGDVDFITTADTAEGASTITVSAWVKLTNNTDYHGLVSHTNGSSASDGWWLTQVVNQNNYNLSLSDADHTTSGFPSTVGNWYYLTVTFNDASNLGNAYHNGVSYVIFSSADQITESASTLKIGKEGSFYGEQPWLGGIDEVHISSSVRTEQWIQTEYNNQSATSTFYIIGTAETESVPSSSGIPHVKVRGGEGTNPSVKIRGDGQTQEGGSSGFPQIASTQTSSRASNALDDSVTLPASIAAGDLIIAFHFSDGAGTRTFPSPWVEIKDAANGASNANIGIAYLIASGGETAVTVSKSITERFTAIAIRISTASWHGTTPPEVSTGATGDDTTPDPDSVTSSWGSADNLFIAAMLFDDSAGGGTVSAYPTNYSSNNVISPDVSSAGRGAIASRELAAASDDPGTFTISPTDQWWAGTVVVRPGTGGGVSGSVKFR